MTFEKVIKHFGNRALRLKDVQRYLDAGGDVNRRDPKMNWSLLLPPRIATRKRVRQLQNNALMKLRKMIQRREAVRA